MKPINAYVGNFFGVVVMLLAALPLASAEIGHEIIEGEHIENEILHDVTIINSDIRNSDIRNADIRDSVLTDTDLGNGSVMSSKIWDSTLEDATINDSKGIRVDIENGDIDASSLIDSTLGNSRTRRSTLTRTSIENSTICTNGEDACRFEESVTNYSSEFPPKRPIREKINRTRATDITDEDIQPLAPIASRTIIVQPHGETAARQIAVPERKQVIADVDANVDLNAKNLVVLERGLIKVVFFERLAKLLETTQDVDISKHVAVVDRPAF